jgi:hypothetical protein
MFEGKLIVGETFGELIDTLHYFLPAGIQAERIEESVQYLVGQTPTEQQIKELTHRLVSNACHLQANRPVLPWTFQHKPEWVPVQVVSVKRQRNNSKKYGGLFTLRILAGSSCPLVMRKWWSLRYCSYISSYFGFSRRPGRAVTAKPARYPFLVMEQFVNLRFYVLVEPKLCTASGPMFGMNLAVTGALLTWNKKLIKSRFRIDPGYTCPKDYANTFPCYKCPSGYNTTCPLATHARDYELKPCAVCKNDKAPFDPDVSLDTCVNCYLAKVKEIPKNG